MQQIYLAIPLLPLFAAIVIGLFGKKLPRAAAHVVTILGVGASFALSVYVLNDAMTSAPYNATVYSWMQSGNFTFEIGFLIDRLSAMMMVVVTFVSLMVHIYTIGYMAEDKGYARFFSYLIVYFLNVDAGDEQQLYATVLWLGSSWFGFISIDWFLVHAPNRYLR